MINLPKIHQEILNYPGSTAGTLYGYDYRGLLVSENHRRDDAGNWTAGGPFYVHNKKKTTNGIHLDWMKVNVPWSGTVYGPNMSSIKPVIAAPPTWASQQSYLSAAYATGYKRTRPGNPMYHLAGAWTENLLSRPPSIPGLLLRRLNFFRALGSEFLNVAFGWIPFLNDVEDLFHMQKDIDRRLAQIIRENGRGIRRRATIVDDNSTSTTTSTSGVAFAFASAPPPNWAPNSGSVLTTQTITKNKVWFAAKYQYYIPDVSSSEWKKNTIAKLRGDSITPEDVYNLIPWSWLIDYFTNVGDVISNACDNAVDNLTCKYSFTMRHTSVETIRSCDTWWGGLNSSGAGLVSFIRPGSCNLTTREIVESKMRVGGGNPFGLDVKITSLSPYQFGILAALGLSRGLVK